MKRTYTIILTTLLVALFAATGAMAQENGDFRSQADGDWSASGTWETFDGNNWVAAGTAPDGSENITIQGTDSVAIDVAVSISGTLTLEGDGPDSGGILEVTDGSLTVEDTGIYNHARDGGEVPTIDWWGGSTIVFSGILGSGPANRDQAFDNIVWNNPGQVSNVSLGLGTVTITGDVRVVDTGSSRFRLTDSGSGDGETLTIEGDVIVEGGAIETTGSSAEATYNVVVMGDIVVHDGTTFATSRGSGGQATWTVHGNFTAHNGAELRDSHDGDSSRVVFGGSTTQTISVSDGASYNGAFNYTVATGADVVVAADSTFQYEDDFSLEGDLTVNGEIAARDTLHVNDGTLTVAAGGTYNHAYDGGVVPIATWADGSTVLFTGIETDDPENGDQDFFNYTWDNAGQVENINIGWDGYTLAGNLTVLNTNGNQFRLTSANTDAPRVITIQGDVVVDGENAEFTATGSGDVADYDITVMGDISITKGGFLSVSRGSGGRAVWTLYGDMTIDGGEIGDSDTDKHGQFRSFVFAADTASDGVPGQTLTANNVSYDSDVYFEVADSSGILLAAGSDFTYEGIFTNYGVFDVDGDATLTFAGDATYDHARDGGSLPTATWEEGSTLSITGMVTSAPDNGNQDFYNIVIDAPGNVENNDLGMRDNTIHGDIDVVTTGSARAYLTNPDSFDTLEVSIMGDINMQQGAFSSNGTGSGETLITIHHYGSINVEDGNFSISRGSGPIVDWYLYEGDFSMAAGKTQNSNAREGSAFIFAGEDVVQHIDVSADVDMANLPIRVVSGAYLDIGTTSFQPNGDNFTLEAGGTLATADTVGFDTNFELAGSSETELSLSTEGHYVLNGTEQQNTGFSLPITVASLTIDNNAGAVQTRPITVTEYLRLASGLFDNTPGVTLGAEAEVIFDGGSLLIPMDGIGGPPSTSEIVWNFDNSADINSWVNGANTSQTLTGSADVTEGDSSLSWTYTVDPSLEWGGSADIQLMYGDYLTNLSDFDGISLDYKVTTPVSGTASFNLKVYTETPDTVAEYHYTVPGVISDDSGEWQTAVILFDDLAIPSWIAENYPEGYDTSIHPDQITEIQMQVLVGSDGSEVSGEVLLDNLAPAEAPLPIPEPPFEIGDNLSYNGSFEHTDLGDTEADAWTITAAEGSETVIVDDAADSDERALKFDVSWNGSANMWENEVVNEPLNVVEGETYDFSVSLKADSDDRVANIYHGLPLSGNWERTNEASVELTTEWTEYVYRHTARATDEANTMRLAVEFNAEDNDGGAIYIDNVRVERVDPVSNEPNAEIPLEFALKQNYPNPFNPTTTISYDVPEAADVSIKIYDITGREVAELVDARKSAGSHEVEWNAAQFATGVYLYRIQAGDFTAVRKLTLIK